MIFRKKPFTNYIIIVCFFLFATSFRLHANLQDQPKTVLVVGGAGYIGSYVNKLLNRSGYNTIVFDNLISGDERTVKYGTFVKGDIGNIEDLHHVFTNYKIDAVMHFAAYMNVGESVDNPAKYYENNVVSTLTLLNTMRQHDVELFIFSSSAAIFGVQQTQRIDENHPKNPINPYGQTKLIIEKILHDYDIAYGLRYTCLRYFNAAGGDPECEIMNHRTNQSNLIPIALRSIIHSKGSISIFGTDYKTRDGTCVRDYIHIHDLATAHILSMEKLFGGANSSSYNLGNGEGFTVREVLASVERATGTKLTITEVDRRQGDPPILVADSTKAKRELLWKPVYSDIDSIVRDAWRTMNFK
jgi:UDP-glucose 4-epimerase